MRTEQMIGDKRCYLYENNNAADILIQAIDGHDLEVLDQEADKIKALTQNHPFTLAAFLISDWNTELSPWEAPAVFGKEDFGAGGEETLSYITDKLLPAIEERYPADKEKRFFLGGYSLSGLFALWAAYRTTIFQGISAVSPSVWFPGWDSFISENKICTPRVYLSLGDKEERTRNKTMARVGDNIRMQYELMCRESSVKECVLEWNPGNHFMDSEVRMAKGFSWLLQSS